MKISTGSLISDLTERTRILLNQAEKLKQTQGEALNRRQAPASWSALECIEHLNLYGDFYLPEIEKAIRNTRHTHPAKIFRSGWLGNYFAQSMLPKEKLNKMKTFKDKNPLGSKLDPSVIDRFTGQQMEILNLLDRARNEVDLNRTRTAISISTVIKLKLGDTFRFLIYHNQRHMVQAFRAAGLSDQG